MANKLTRQDVIKAIKTLRGEVHSNPNMQLVNALRLYRDRKEWDGSVDDAIKCLRQAEFEIEDTGWKGDGKGPRGPQRSKASLIGQLSSLGVAVIGGKVRKADIQSALQSLAAATWQKSTLEKLGLDTEGDGPAEYMERYTLIAVVAADAFDSQGNRDPGTFGYHILNEDGDLVSIGGGFKTIEQAKEAAEQDKEFKL